MLRIIGRICRYYSKEIEQDFVIMLKNRCIDCIKTVFSTSGTDVDIPWLIGSFQCINDILFILEDLKYSGN